MAKIFMNLRGAFSSGGPTVAAARLARGFKQRGHQITYDDPRKADWALCIIESGKVLRKRNGKMPRVAVRVDGFYMSGYWTNKTPDRKWRPDMDALHSAIKRDIARVDLMIYQSSFSKTMIDLELAERKNNFVIINNGVDIKRFVSKPHKNDGVVRLFHHGVIRNDYILTSLLEVYEELKLRGHKVELTIVGSIKGCKKVLMPYSNNQNIKWIGAIPNSNIHSAFVPGSIGVYPRQGSSNDNCVVECLSSAIPCVIPSFGGNTDLLTSGQEGIIVDSNNWDYGIEYSKRIADAVEKMIPDLEGYKKRAREHAVKNLSLDIMVNKYLKAMCV